MATFERGAMVSGLGMSAVGRNLERSTVDLALDAALQAIGDAGLVPSDIDGLVTAPLETTPWLTVQEGLGMPLNWWSEGGGMPSAVMAVASGMCRHVLLYRSVHRLPGTFPTPSAPEGHYEWMIPFHLYSAAGSFAMHLQRHMHLYGTTREQLGWIPITSRYHASLNETAVLRDPMTMDEYLSCRPISHPIGLLDCDLPVDGAVAVVVSSSSYGPNAPKPPVYVEAMGTANHGRVSWDQRADFPSLAADDCASQLWSRTDLRPDDVDVAQLYDGFSFLALAWLEALGFCGKGEGGAFVEGGDRIRLGGRLPLNTFGGQLSAGRLHGYWHVHEAVSQLRGEATGRQVPDAEVAVTSAIGAPYGWCLLLTR